LKNKTTTFPHLLLLSAYYPRSIQPLSTCFRSLVLPLNREIGFNCQKVGESCALLIGELGAKTILVEYGLALRLRHLAKVSEGARDQAPAVDGKPAKLLHGAPDLSALSWSKVLQCLVTLERAAALFGRHVIEVAEVVQHALLGLCWKIIEARLALQRTVLLREREVAVTVHPLR
jgi:hypothetical protein